MISSEINFMPTAHDNIHFYWPSSVNRVKLRSKKEAEKSLLTSSSSLSSSWDDIQDTQSSSFNNNYGGKMTSIGQQKTSFDERIKRNITVPLGSVTFLQCKINNLGDKIVSISKLNS